MTSRPIPGLKGHFHADGHVELEFNVHSATLLAPGGEQYLPCVDCGRVYVVAEELREFTCEDCENCRALTPQDLRDVLEESGPRLFSELKVLLRERCGARHLDIKRVRQLFWDAQDRWPGEFSAHRVENDPNERYVMLEKKS